MSKDMSMKLTLGFLYILESFRANGISNQGTMEYRLDSTKANLVNEGINQRIFIVMLLPLKPFIFYF